MTSINKKKLIKKTINKKTSINKKTPIDKKKVN